MPTATARLFPFSSRAVHPPSVTMLDTTTASRSSRVTDALNRTGFVSSRRDAASIERLSHRAAAARIAARIA
ncbi:MAG TPA: hypothetical protein VKH43_09705 [Thermoanaerobaculia bacterium]|nr:hypothetical protein [Thermoanaerobaculia bacterium]